MRIVVVHPGADFSTHDVYRGIVAGLRELGHDVLEYDHGTRLWMAREALKARNEGYGLGRAATIGEQQYEAGHAIYADILHHGAEAVVVVAGDRWAGDHTVLLRRAGMVVGTVYTEAPYFDAGMAPRLGVGDIAWVNERASVRPLNQAFGRMELPGRAVYLPTAWTPGMHEPAAKATEALDVPSYDVVHVGTMFEERVRLLEQVDWTGIDLGLYGHFQLLDAPRWLYPDRSQPVPSPWRLRILRALSAWGVAGVSPLWQYVRGGVVTNRVTAELYRRARIGLNVFRTSVEFMPSPEHALGAESMTPRCYELAATATFWISDYREELHERLGGAVPMFRTPAELRRLVLHYLSNPAEAARQSAQLPGMVRSDTYLERARRIAADLQDALEARRHRPAA